MAHRVALRVLRRGPRGATPVIGCRGRWGRAAGVSRNSSSRADSPSLTTTSPSPSPCPPAAPNRTMQSAAARVAMAPRVGAAVAVSLRRPCSPSSASRYASAADGAWRGHRIPAPPWRGRSRPTEGGAGEGERAHRPLPVIMGHALGF